MNNEQHPLVNTLQNLKDFREELTNFSAPENVDGWSLSNLPTYFWETIGECINDIEEHIKIKENLNISDVSCSVCKSCECEICPRCDSKLIKYKVVDVNGKSLNKNSYICTYCSFISDLDVKHYN